MKYLETLLAILCVLVIHTPKGETAALSPPSEEVVTYINRRIDEVLAANPEKDSSEILFTVFNAERTALLNARIGDNPQAGDDIRAEQALQNFNGFISDYNNIRSRLEAAIDDLNVIERNQTQPIIVRYNALELLNEIRDSNSIAAAERALRNYNDFRRNLTVTPITPITPEPPITPVTPPLSEEYREYFEEIIRILRQLGINANSPTVLSFLERLLLRPTDLKELAADARRLLRAFLQFLG